MTLSAIDPEVNGVAAGAGTTLLSTGESFAAYSGSMTFAEGSHRLIFQSLDLLGNA